jgi:hypothetical protein
MLSDLKELRESWPAVRAAQWAIIVALCIGGVAGYGASSLYWSGQNATLKERVAQLQDAKTPSQLRIVEVTDSFYRVKLNDDVIQVNNAKEQKVTISLPSGFPKGKLVTIKDKKGDAFAMHIVIVSEVGKIDTLPELVIATNKGSFSLIWDGSDWSMN